MTSFDEAQLLIRLLREGREYYAFARDETRDPEITEVFALAVKARTDLLDDLVATRLLFQTSPAHPTRVLSADLGYEELRHQFDPLHPLAHAAALHERERRVVHLMDDLFEADSSEKLHAAMSAHYAQFTEVEDCLARWSQPYQAAVA
ncbi:MAG TPA: hypothetical protein VLF18_17585 [Tahibacter sp.]|uniref:hypothetical protein n=1 Tax=Tahibacter sp. TaxID=2056211 RepID=UPI002D17C500|nr:hypothetical protein [Tahibacter sp.]HSX62003.1 hypothetical protein [Tahibacter sp.]